MNNHENEINELEANKKDFAVTLVFTVTADNVEIAKQEILNDTDRCLYSFEVLSVKELAKEQTK